MRQLNLRGTRARYNLRSEQHCPLMPTTRRALSENEDMDASQPLKRSSDAAAAALFEDLPSPAADPASADPCPRTLAFARSELEARGESHGLAHAKRVRALALAIYAELGGDDAQLARSPRSSTTFATTSTSTRRRTRAALALNGGTAGSRRPCRHRRGRRLYK